jgi:magnesium-protoporphyrin IX monomethyl ester (oxidative) cyclase
LKPGENIDPVILVCAPFFSVVRPALGISLLKGGLEARGIHCRIEYLNLQFAEKIGVSFHESVATGVANTLLVGEWIFSPYINDGRRAPEQERYLEEMAKLYSLKHREQLAHIRRAAGLFVEEQAIRLSACNPRVLGFTTSFQQNCASLAIAKRVKELNREIIICFGGANCEGPMGEGLLDCYPEIDHVFSGEADLVFPQFVAHVLDPTLPFPASDSILSRQQSAGHGRTGSPANGERVRDLDSLPDPDFSDYFGELHASSFQERIRPALVIESSRGCWWGAKKHCLFCGLNGSLMSFRTKSPSRVMDEMDRLSAAYSVSQFLAADNIMDMKHVERVFGELKKNRRRYRFFYEVKSNLTRAQLETIAAGGVDWIQPGIENLDDDLLRAMGKGVTALQNICVLRNCMELGIRVTWTILAGFPGETAEQYARMKALVPLIEHLDPPMGCVPIRLDRFSPYFERAAEFGFEQVRPVWPYAAVYALDSDQLEKIAYFFESGSHGTAPHIADMQEVVHTWNRRFFNSGNEGPTLSAKEFGLGQLIEDQRSCAMQRWRCLSTEESAVLRAFREPRNIHAVLEQFDSDSTTRFQTLVDWKYILVQGDRALSLIVELNALGARRPQSFEFPGGHLMPPKAALSPVAG